jgi:hypothetical protein
MKKTREIRRRVQIATVICFALIAAICVAQNSPGSQTGLQTGGQLPSSSGGASPLGTAGGLDNTPSPFPDNSRQKRNEERQRRLESDTQKLVALTSQLRAEIASTGAETMSPEMLKQMAEIEKLARSVKDKMRE